VETEDRTPLDHLRHNVSGQPHERNPQRWASLVDNEGVRGLQRVMNGLDRDSIEMGEVSPMGGLLSERDRVQVLEELAAAGWCAAISWSTRSVLHAAIRR
jgi:hypothetical protein